MNKFIKFFTMLFLLSACANNTPNIKNKNYVMNENGVNITLKLSEDGSYSGKVVNNYFGNYKLKGNTIKFSLAGATMMMGPRNEMEAEGRFFEVLQKINSFELNNKELLFYTTDGKTLKFIEN